MTLPFDPSEIIGVFVAETKDHLEKLNQGVLSLEKNPDNPSLIKELMRSAHNLKGAAATVGFEDIKEIAHRIEDVFIAVREGKLRHQPAIGDRIFFGLDTIKEIMDGITAGRTEPKDISGLLKKFEETISGRAKEEKSTTEENPTPSSSSESGTKAPDSSDESASPSAAPIEEFVRVPLSRINNLLNLGGELVINKIKSAQKIGGFKRSVKMIKELETRLALLGEQVKNAEEPIDSSEMVEMIQQCSRDVRSIKEESLSLSEEIMAEALHVDPIVDELEERIKEIRMLPCSTLFAGFPRLVRDLAREQEKEIEFVVEGGKTELDKMVLEGIKEPLMHILRNAVDHGIEPPDERAKQGKPRSATIRLSAIQQGGNVTIEVRDDGRGMDVERIKAVALSKGLATADDLEKLSERELFNFIFVSGFSTSRFITDVSGRGVGMDVVRSRIETLKGRIEISSQKGSGTGIQIEIPLTVAIIHALLVKAADKTFGIPLLSVDEVVRLSPEEIQPVENKKAFTLRDHTVPLVRLDETLGIPNRQNAPDSNGSLQNVVILDTLYGQVGFIVDLLVGKEEIFIKSLGFHIRKVRNVSGATVLATGEIIVILDPADLVMSSKLTPEGVLTEKPAVAAEGPKRRLLVVDDSITTRELIRSILEDAGYEVEAAVDGLDAMAKLSGGKFDLIVSDVEMPGMDGYELCRSIRNDPSYKEIPLVFVTARSSEQERRRGIEVGAQAYIVKNSFDQTSLTEVISRLII